MEASIRIYVDWAECRLPTVCPQLWANQPERTPPHSANNAGFPGMLNQFRTISALRRGFESLQGHFGFLQKSLINTGMEWLSPSQNLMRAALVRKLPTIVAKRARTYAVVVTRNR